MVNNSRNVSIISISLTKKMIEEINKFQKQLGFTGRSELIRAGIREFVQKEKQRSGMVGEKFALLTVVHSDEYDSDVAKLKHDYEDLIMTHLHSKLDGDRCVELFLMGGDAQRIEIMTNGFVINKRMDNVELLVL